MTRHCSRDFLWFYTCSTTQSLPVCQQILHIFSFFARAACRMSNSLWPQIEALRFAKALASHSPKKEGALREHQHSARQSRPHVVSSVNAIPVVDKHQALCWRSLPYLRSFRRLRPAHSKRPWSCTTPLLWLLKLRSWPLLDSLQQHVPGVYKYVYVYIYMILYTYIHTVYLYNHIERIQLLGDPAISSSSNHWSKDSKVCLAALPRTEGPYIALGRGPSHWSTSIANDSDL